MQYYNLKVHIIATKYDKVKKNARDKQNKIIRDTLKLEEGENFITFSSFTKKGKDEVYEIIENSI